MKHRNNNLAVMLALAGVIAVAPVFTAAAERQTGGTTQPAPAGSTVQPQPPVLPLAGEPRPLKGPIQLDPKKVKKLSKWEPPPVEWHEVTAACQNCGNNWSVATNQYAYAKVDLDGALKTCSTKAYSVQDQQAAGCKGNDTMDQCTEKLYDHCMSINFSKAKAKFAKTSEEELAAVRKLIQKAQAYVNYVEWRLNTYGK